MESKYIRSDLFMHRIANETLFSPADLTLIKCVMEQEPGEDVKPVVHAHWDAIDQGVEGYETFLHVLETLRCSHCGMERTTEDGYMPQYCEDCGAKMNEEESKC